MRVCNWQSADIALLILGQTLEAVVTVVLHRQRALEYDSEKTFFSTIKTLIGLHVLTSGVNVLVLVLTK